MTNTILQLVGLITSGMSIQNEPNSFDDRRLSYLLWLVHSFSAFTSSRALQITHHETHWVSNTRNGFKLSAWWPGSSQMWRLLFSHCNKCLEMERKSICCSRLAKKTFHGAGYTWIMHTPSMSGQYLFSLTHTHSRSDRKPLWWKIGLQRL